MGKCPFLREAASSTFMKSFTKEIGERTRNLQVQYMSPSNVLRFRHGHTWDAPANELGDKSGGFEKHGVTTEIKLSDIAEGKMHTIFEQIFEVSESLHSQIQTVLFEVLNRSTEKSGQVISMSGKKIPDAMYEMLERMELPLDGDGELSMPSMFVHPSQTQSIFKQLKEAGPDFEKRIEDLKARKKHEAETRELARVSRYERRNT
jgi:hypothetical protein